MKYTLVAAGAFLFSLSIHATTLFVDFTNSGGVQSGSGYTNVRTYTSGGVTVTVTGWGLTGNGDTTFQNANVGQYSGLGLGVCDKAETLNCSSPSHQVDNSDAYDFVLAQFSSTVNPSTITIQPYGTWDRDVTYYTGNAAAGLNLNGATLAGLSALGLTNVHNDDSTVSSNQRTVTLISGGVNSILFGARVGGDNNPDYFKIAGLTGSVNPAPEPATMAVAGAALIALAVLGRRVNRR